MHYYISCAFIAIYLLLEQVNPEQTLVVVSDAEPVITHPEEVLEQQHEPTNEGKHLSILFLFLKAFNMTSISLMHG